MKSSTYTSIRHRVTCSMGGLCVRDVPSMFIVCSSRGCCGGLSIFFHALSSEISLTVSDAE